MAYEKYYSEGGGDADGVEYEYYEEEETLAGTHYGKVQDIDGEFVDSSDEETTGADAAEGGYAEESATNDAEEAEGTSEENRRPAEGKSGRSFWRWRERVSKEDAEAADVIDDSKVAANAGGAVGIGDENAVEQWESENSQAVEEGRGDTMEEEEEDYLFTTPIPLPANGDGAKPPGKLQLINRTVPRTGFDMEGSDFEEGADDVALDDSECNPKEGTVKAKSHWRNTWSQQTQDKRQPSRKRERWNPTTTSSKASFISSPFYSGTSSSRGHRSPSLRPSSVGIGALYSRCAASISRAVAVVVRTAGTALRGVAAAATSAAARWASAALATVRHACAFLWHGPVEGVTTTGLAAREGGLRALLAPSSPVALVVASFAVLGLLTVWVRTLRHEGATANEEGRWGVLRGILSRKKDAGRHDGHDSEDDAGDGDAVMPPSVEEELEFLNRKFYPANPSTKDRVTKAIITKQNKVARPSLLRRGGNKERAAPKSRRGQRQFTIKSIQTWWKERPKSQSIAIIEPTHLRGPQRPPLSQEIKRLQKQLTVSEQERAILQQDAQRARQEIQRARAVVAQNRWLEKQTAAADQILTRAVEVERRKAHEEMGRVRESMREVLERERMLMRGSAAGGRAPSLGRPEQRREGVVGGRNDLDLVKAGPQKFLDGVNIVREIDVDDETSDEDDKTPWAAL